MHIIIYLEKKYRIGYSKYHDLTISQRAREPEGQKARRPEDQRAKGLA